MKQNSIVSGRRIEPWVLLAIAALSAVLFYLLISALVFGIGFPLDDAWIHLTYARNVAGHAEWAFQPGERSAGSTAPLWTGLLAIGFFLGLGPYLWPFLLGWAVLALLAVYAEYMARKLVVSYQARLPWVGLFFIFAWHLTWSAVSGMETLLHALIVFVVLSALTGKSRRYLALGLLTGLSVWVRPDGLTLLGPLLFVGLFSETSWPRRGEAVWRVLLGFGAVFFPYVLFNLALSGNPMPNTFYAKQAEYGLYWSSKTLPERVGDYLWPLLASPFLALLPAAVVWLFRNLRAGNRGVLAGLIWVVGYVGIYFLRLPAYQHGRYIIPALPVLYLWGMLGFLELIAAPGMSKRLISLWQMILLVLTLAFTWLGARQNALDVYWVESEIVATARWVETNLPAEARLAVHDIGALGYYVDNPLVDMAGLISPDVIPFIRDEVRLAAYLDARSVDYLVTFPSFYPRLTSVQEPVFEAGLASGAAEFEEHMQVYRWR